MNKEQQELVDMAYRLYADSHWIPPSNPKGKLLSDQLFSVIPMEHSKESFINECKMGGEFSKKWDLKVEKKELSQDERKEILYGMFKKGPINVNGKTYTECAPTDINFGFFNIPTKLIKVTYKDKTVESYE